MIKLKVFQTYYQSTQYDEYGLKNLPSFVEIVNTTEYNYKHSELNPFWSEYMFIKHVYEHLGEYDCEYIGFDQYKRHFDYDKILEIIKDKDDVCFINCVEKVNVYDHYALSHKEKDFNIFLEILNNKGQGNMAEFFLSGEIPFFWGSCFIMPKQRFSDMCKELFSVLDELDSFHGLNYDVEKYKEHFLNENKKRNEYLTKSPSKITYEYQRRCFGYLAERFVSAWIILNFYTEDKLVEGNFFSIIPEYNLKYNKIVLISHELSLTGAPRALLNLGITLKELGKEIIVLSMTNGPMKQEFIQNGMRCIAVTDFSERLQNNDQLLFGVLNWAELIICNTIITASVGYSIQDLDAKKILWIHEGTFGFHTVRTSHRKSFPCFDQVFTVGEYSNEIAEMYSGMHCGILNYCLDRKTAEVVAQKPDKTNDIISIAVVGSVSTRKGHHLLLNCIKNLPDTMKGKLKFKIIGRNENMTLSSELKELDSSLVEVTGQLSNQETLEEINKADALLCPSIDDPMPICCAEAFQCETPVMVSTQSGTARLIKNSVNGFVIKPTIQGLSDGLNKLLKNKDKLRKIGKKGRLIFDNNFTYRIFRDNVIRKLLID